MISKKDANLITGMNLSWVSERMRLNREDFARVWNMQKESVDKTLQGQRSISSDKVLTLFDEFAITPNEIFLGEGSTSKARQKVIELRGSKYVGVYKIITPEIIISDIEALAPPDRDDTVRRLIKMLSTLL